MRKKHDNIKFYKKSWFWYLIIMPITINFIFFYSSYKAYEWKENRDKAIYIDGFEVGHITGLTEGYEAAENEYFDNLSTNPKVSALFKKYFPKKQEAKIMRAISLAESQGKQIAINTKNKNGSMDSGFFQINTIHRKKNESMQEFTARMYDLETNFIAARKVLDVQGYTAWSVYNNGKYLSYLK